MAQNYRQRSNSSASSRGKRISHERAHAKSPRHTQSTTPKVLSPNQKPDRQSASRSRTRSTAGARSGTSRAHTQASRNARAARSSQSQSRRTASTASQKGRGIGLKLGIAIAVVVALVGGFTALYFSSAFTITEIKVVGNSKLQSDYVVALADIPEDSTFLRTDVDSITAHLLSDAWIQDAEIERSFPSTLTLNITERAIAAVVDIVPETASETAQRWVISYDAIWVAPVVIAPPATAAAAPEQEAAPSEEQAEDAADSTDENNEDDSSTARLVGTEVVPEELVDIPKIKDVSAAVRPKSGEVETDEGILNALLLLDGFSPEMREMVASISAPNAAKTSLTLYNNVGVAFGAAEDIEAKERAIATKLEEHEGTLTYINVRLADRISWRTTE